MTISTNRLKLHYVWFGAGYVLLVFVATVSLIPISNDGGVSDKLMHLLTYLVLSSWFSLLVMQARSLLSVGIGLILFGILIEMFQAMTSYRSAEFADAVANSLGVLIGLVFHFTPLHRVLRWLDVRLYRLWQ